MSSTILVRATWKDVLAGFFAPTPIPVATKHLAPTREERTTRSRKLSPATTEALRAFSREHSVEVPTLLRAAWTLLLARYSSERDVVVGGMTASSREPLPLRMAVDLETPIATWLAAFAERERWFVESGDATLADLRLWCDVPPTEPLFHSVFLQDGESGGTTDAPLVVVAKATGDPAEIAIRFAPSSFDAAAIDRMLGHLCTLLESIVASPDERTGRLVLLTPEERQQIVVAWNETAAEFPRELCLHELFERQAARTPRAVAVTFEGVSLTYEELSARATRLALHLAGLGVGPGVLVGLMTERCLDVATSVLGILKAGGAYVPLDPEYPSERLEMILADSKAPVVVTQRKLVEKLPAHYRGSVVCLDGSWEPRDASPESRPAKRPCPRDLAYVIYTSGSTGKPKGVPIRHGGVVSQMTSFAATPGMTCEDSILCVASLSFDVATLDLFLPWSVGARVVIAPESAKRDGARLRALLERTNATFLQATPVTWRLLMAAGWEGSRALTALCGGEALTRELADALLAKCRAVWNLYGPTETTIWATRHEVKPGTGPVSIGRPIANTRVYVLDANLSPVPVGVPGELCIAGAGVGDGYLERPELSAARFVPDPFSSEPGERLFRSGDLGRQSPDGSFEHLGRMDFQVKIHGFRIELGEVESALLAHPGIHQAVVVAREDVPNQRKLVAYVVTHKPAPTAATLRRFLATKLAPHELPSVFVRLPALPVNANMKVDRRALPAPLPAPADLDRTPLPPRDEVERQLVATWEDALGIRPIGVLDDLFMELGADSLVAADVAAKLSHQLGKNVTPDALFEARTIEAHAASLRARAEFSVHSQLVTLSIGRSKPELFLVHSAGADAFAYLPLVRKLDGEDTVHVFQNRFRYTEGRYASVEEMAREYLGLLRRKQPEGPYRLGGWSLGGTIAFEMANQLVAAGEEVTGLLLLDTNFPWSLPYRAWLHAKHWLAGLRYRLARRAPGLARAIPGTRAKLARLRGLPPLERLDWLLATLAFLGVDDAPAFVEDLFPGTCDAEELGRLAPDEAWEALAERVRASAPDGRDRPPPPVATTRQKARITAMEHWLEHDYAPSWVYPGEITLFAIRGADYTGTKWQRYTRKPLVLREFDVAATARFDDPHVAMMQDENVELFADEFKRFVERTRLAQKPA